MSFVSAGELIGDQSDMQSVFVCVSVVCGSCVTLLAISLFRPSAAHLAGSDDAEKLRSEYLNMELEDAVNQVIADRASCLSDATVSNGRVGNAMRLMLLAFLGQVLCVATAVGAGVFSV